MDSGADAIRRTQKLNIAIGAGLTLAALMLYLATLAPTVLEADSGEFQFVPWLPGIAHPTGYPLYILLGWLWTHLLPLGNVAWRMNLLSAVLAALAVGLTYAVSGRLLTLTWPHTPPPARMITAAVVAATFAVTPTFWSQAIIAEVYALHMLLVALIFWLALNLQPIPTRRVSLGLALIFGLSLAHHRTTVLLTPALLVYLWLIDQRRTSFLDKLKPLAWHLLLVAAPLLLYLSLPLLVPYTPYATILLSNSQTLHLYQNSAWGWLQHVTATVFTGELQPAAIGSQRFLLAGQFWLAQVGWIGIVLGLAGLVIWWRQRRFDLLALTGLAALTQLAFNLIYFIGDVYVLFIPTWWLACLWLGLGGLGLAQRAAGWFVRHKMGAPEEAAFGYLKPRLEQNMSRLITIGLMLFFFALPVTLLAESAPQISQRHNTAAAQRWQEILQSPLPEAAILLSNDRNEMMPMWYFQFVENQRPDLTGLFPLIVPEPAYATVGGVLDQAMASGRPVYLIKPMAGLEIKAALEPAGHNLFRAVPLTAPPAIRVEANLPPATRPNQPQPESIHLTGFDASPLVAGQPLTITLHWQPTQPLTVDYTSYVHLLTPDGQRLAQSDHRPGGDFYPSSHWSVGEVLRDRHTLTIPEDLASGVYLLRAGMYYQPEPGVIIGMGDGLNIGELTVD